MTILKVDRNPTALQGKTSNWLSSTSRYTNCFAKLDRRDYISFQNLLEEDNFSVKALREIVCHCCYGIKLESFETRRLIDSISKSCLNEEAIDTNRFRFSNSPDYYVPNKTLYKDYIEFIKVNCQSNK